MKPIKTFRITPENNKLVKEISKHLDRSEGWVINMAISEINRIVIRNEISMIDKSTPIIS